MNKVRVADVTLSEARYPPGLRLPRHAHDQAYFCLVLRGGYDEQVAGRSIACQPSSLVFRPPHEPHSNVFVRAGTHCFLVDVEPGWLQRFHDANAAQFAGPVKQDGGPSAWLAFRLLREWQRMDELSPLAIEGLSLELGASLGREAQTNASPAPPRWLRQARELLDACYSQPLTLNSVSKAVGVHPIHLARVFRRFYGLTMADYIRKRRVHHACQALRAFDTPLVQIGLAAGFAHQAHFTRVFKRLTGMTPGEYRNHLSR